MPLTENFRVLFPTRTTSLPLFAITRSRLNGSQITEAMQTRNGNADNGNP